MKTSLFVLAMVAAGCISAHAQTQTNGTATTHLDAQISTRLEFKAEPMNEMTRGRFVYSGVFIEAMKATQPAQLINPLAPPEYGVGDCNLHRDIITGKPNGFKFFSIRF